MEQPETTKAFMWTFSETLKMLNNIKDQTYWDLEPVSRLIQEQLASSAHSILSTLKTDLEQNPSKTYDVTFDLLTPTENGLTVEETIRTIADVYFTLEDRDKSLFPLTDTQVRELPIFFDLVKEHLHRFK